MENAASELFRNMFIALIVSATLAPVFIKLMYLTNQTVEYKKTKLGGGMKGDNSLFMKVVNADENNGTPNMGGIIVWIIVPILTVLLATFSKENQLIIYGFILFGFWGFLDVLINNLFKKNERYRYLQEVFWVRVFRFSASVLLNLSVIYFAYYLDLIPEINLGIITFAFSPLLIPIFAVIGQFAIYSGEITDGLDGLMVGIFIIIFSALAVLLGIQGNFSYFPLIGVILGVLVIDLYFNIPPARFYNGGPSAMPLSLTAFLIGLTTNNLIPYLVISSLTWLIMSSSLIQIISMRFFRRRIFKIAPIHHHFQAIGWPSYKVTMRFWLYTLILASLGIYLSILM